MMLWNLYNLLLVVGFLMWVTGTMSMRTLSWFYVKYGLVGVGFALIVFGGVYGAEQRQKAVTAAKADIKARTVVTRGVVYHSVHQNGLNGCSLVLEELPSVTFVLPEQDSYGRSCANIKLGDLVDVKYVQPKKKDASNWSMEYVEALDFFDRTDIDPPPHN